MNPKELQSKIAVLLIDMQNVFVDHLRPGAKERIIPNQIEVLKVCAKNDILVYVIELDAPNFPKDIMELNSELSKVLENVPVRALITKNKDDAFAGTPLEKMLLEQGIVRLVLTGVNAQGCVLDTAASAIERGFKIATAAALIAGQPTDREDDCAPWYAEKGIFFSDGISGILDLLDSEHGAPGSDRLKGK